MAGTIAALQKTLEDTIKAFNGRKFDEVKRHLAANLTVTPLRVRPSFKRNPTAVTYAGDKARESLHDQFIDHAQFLDEKYTIDPPKGEATKATIKGTATWKDDNGTDKLEFNFVCVFDDHKKSWLFETVSASVVGEKT